MNDATEIVVIRDRSGSMESIKHDMDGGLRRFVEDQKAVPGICRMSLYDFDTVFETVYEGVPVNDVKDHPMVPRGATALLDAVGRGINALGARLSAMPQHERPGKVVVLVITDGHENASLEFTKPQVRAMVQAQTGVYKWQFAFLGADLQAFEDAQGIGISVATSYVATPDGTADLYSRVAKGVSTYRSDTSASATLNIAPAPVDTPEEEASRGKGR